MGLKRNTVKMRVLVLLVAVLVVASATVILKTEEQTTPGVVSCDPNFKGSVYNYRTTLLNGTAFHFFQIRGNKALFVPSSKYDDRAAPNQLAAREYALNNPDSVVLMFSTAQFAFGEIFTKEGEFLNVLKHEGPEMVLFHLLTCSTRKLPTSMDPLVHLSSP